MFDYTKLDNPNVLAFIFHPCRIEKTKPVQGSVDLEFVVEKDINLSCRFHTASQDAPTILYFHGNGEIVSDYDEIGPMYTKAGMNFLVTDYRGYGWSSGIPTVTSMFNDAHFLLLESVKWLRRNDYTGSLFVMGRSLGSACAIDLCRLEKELIKGLIIESGFCDTLPLLKTLGMRPTALDIQEEDCFNNRKKISKIKHPTFILHGSHDSLIPAVEAEKLQAFSGAKSKEFQLIPGADHNSMISTGGTYYFMAIRQFIEKVIGASSWRKRRKQSITDKHEK